MFKTASCQDGITLFGSGYYLGVSSRMIGRPLNKTPTAVNYHVSFRDFRANSDSLGAVVVCDLSIKLEVRSP